MPQSAAARWGCRCVRPWLEVCHSTGLLIIGPWQAAAARFRRVALSVHPENPAQNLYRRCGFVQVDVRRTYLIMVCDLRELAPGP